MSAGCAPSEIRSECAARGMDHARTVETMALVNALVAGYYDGEQKSSADEPPLPARRAGQEPPENLPREDMVDPARAAAKALRVLDPMLVTWKASYFAEHETAESLLADLGMDPLDLFAKEDQEALCQALAERPVEDTPEYFEPELIQAAAESIVRRFRGN